MGKKNPTTDDSKFQSDSDIYYNSHKKSEKRGRDHKPSFKRDFESGRKSLRSRGYSSKKDIILRRDIAPKTSSSDELYRTKSERNYDNSIFIGNIPFNATYDDIENIFKKDFDIIRADIVTSRGRSRGMATVEFLNHDDVKKAIEKYDAYVFRDREIFVRQDYPPPEKKRDDIYARKSRYHSSRSGRSDYLDKRGRDYQKENLEIYIGNLPYSSSWQSLKDLMREAGDVARADVILDKWSKSKKYGIVSFYSEEEALRAIEMFNDYEIEGRKLDVHFLNEFSNYFRGSKTSYRFKGHNNTYSSLSYNRSKNSSFVKGVTGNGEQTKTIFVSNLPYATTTEDLYELFESIGNFNKAEIQYTETGKPIGNGVVEFESVELAESAIHSLNNYLYGGRNIQVSYAKT